MELSKKFSNSFWPKGSCVASILKIKIKINVCMTSRLFLFCPLLFSPPPRLPWNNWSWEETFMAMGIMMSTLPDIHLFQSSIYRPHSSTPFHPYLRSLSSQRLFFKNLCWLEVSSQMYSEYIKQHSNKWVHQRGVMAWWANSQGSQKAYDKLACRQYLEDILSLQNTKTVRSFCLHTPIHISRAPMQMD